MPFLTPQEEAPLNTCKECKAQECIKTGKVCDKVEALLKPLTTGRRSWLNYHSGLFEPSPHLVIVEGIRKGKPESIIASKGKRKHPHISD